MKIVACYIRVSTGDKNQVGQRREIDQWLKSKRINSKTVRWYTDKSTAKKLSRQAFEKLRADIANREVDTVVVWRLDRLSSTMSEGLSILCDWSNKPLRIVSVTQNIDFKGGAGKTIAAVVQGPAEMAFETKREQLWAGWRCLPNMNLPLPVNVRLGAYGTTCRGEAPPSAQPAC